MLSRYAKEIKKMEKRLRKIREQNKGLLTENKRLQTRNEHLQAKRPEILSPKAIDFALTKRNLLDSLNLTPKIDILRSQIQ